MGGVPRYQDNWCVVKILFVCSGNTCRSAMAEGLARRWALQHNYLNWEFASAGTLNIEGAPASENAVIACDEVGVDISAHRSQGLTVELLEAYDYIFGMGNAHVNIGRKLAPAASGKIFLLGAFGLGASEEEIPDPVGMELVFFREVRDLIMAHLNRVLPYIADES